MDFILVPDALAASETRHALAQRNTMGAKVGSFSVLLETLAALWLIEPSELDWDIALQEQALAMGDAFWKDSICIDEPATIAELKAGLQFLFNYWPLGIQPAEIQAPANRYERYYNDLVGLLEPSAANQCAPTQQFAKVLFHPETGTIYCEGLHWLTCRDHVHEVEAVTCLIQTALDQGTAPERIVVVVPRGGDYEAWLETHFEYAGIIASNVRPGSVTFDWQAALVHELLTNLVQRDIPMARMSVMINPLMPWSANIGHKLAEQFGKGQAGNRVERRGWSHA